MKKPWLLALLLMLFIGAAFLCARLTHDHYQFLSGARQGSSYCNISTWINCDAVTASAYATLFGLTSSSLGLGAFLLFILITLASMFAVNKPREKRFYLSLLLLGTTVSTLQALWLLWVSLFKIRALCINCLITDGITLAALVIVVVLCRESFPDSRGFLLQVVNALRSPLRLGGWAVIALICFLLPISWDRHLHKVSLQQQEQKSAVLRQRLKTMRPALLNTRDSASTGSDQSQVTLVTYSDFACPFCRRAAFVSKAVVHNYREQVRLVFKHFPLDTACNYRLQRTAHPFACEVARGSLCALEQERFWPYHDALFETTPPFSSTTAEVTAEKLGLDMAAFTQCMAAERTYRKLRQDIEEAHRLGVQGTPAFFFNGRKFSGFLAAPQLRALIEESLLMTTDQETD